MNESTDSAKLPPAASTPSAAPRTQPAPLPSSPYLGLRSFSEADRELYYGREAETEELFHLVRRETLSVVFGMSGLGKSSLLRAGLFPRLRDAGLFPVVVRLAYGDELVPQLRAVIAREIAERDVDAAPPPDDQTLWEYFHRTPFWSARNRPLVPVLVIDQFEELFTLGKDARGRAALLTELADLVENRIPVALRQAGDPDALPPAFQVAKAKVVLALREDYLARLEDLRSTMPSIARGRFRLRPMDGAQAVRAVLHARTQHLVEPAVAERIVQFVAGARGDTDLASLTIEPALLSLVCRQLDELRMRHGEPAISADLLSGESSRILDDFYATSIADLSPRIVDHIEEQLLTPDGHRTTVAMSRIDPVPGVAAAVATLIDRRILRIEERLGRPHAEVIHDVLTRVIVARRDRRRDLVARRRRSRRWLFGAGAAFALVVFALGATLYVRARNRLEEEAEWQRREVEAERRANAAKSASVLVDEARAMIALGDPWGAARVLGVAYAIPGDDRSPELAMLTRQMTALNEMLAAVLQPSSGVTALAFSGDGSKLFAGHQDGSVSMWSTTDWKLTVLDNRPNGGESLRPPQAVTTLAVSVDGRYAAVGFGSDDASDKVWDTTKRVALGIKGVMTGVVHVSSDGGSVVVTRGNGASLYRWENDGYWGRWEPPELSEACWTKGGPRLRKGDRPNSTTRIEVSGDGKTLAVYRYAERSNARTGELTVFSLVEPVPARLAAICDSDPVDLDRLLVDASGEAIAVQQSSCDTEPGLLVPSCKLVFTAYRWTAASKELQLMTPRSQDEIYVYATIAADFDPWSSGVMLWPRGNVVEVFLPGAPQWKLPIPCIARGTPVTLWSEPVAADLIDKRLAMAGSCGEFSVVNPDGSIVAGQLPRASYSAIRISAAAQLSATLSSDGTIRVWRLRPARDPTITAETRSPADVNRLLDRIAPRAVRQANSPPIRAPSPGTKHWHLDI